MFADHPPRNEQDVLNPKNIQGMMRYKRLPPSTEVYTQQSDTGVPSTINLTHGSLMEGLKKGSEQGAVASTTISVGWLERGRAAMVLQQKRTARSRFQI